MIISSIVGAVCLAGCSSISLRTEARLTVRPPNGQARQLSYEAIGFHELPGWSAACWITGIFYGGACWGYLSLPDGDMIAVERNRLEAFVASIGACTTASNITTEHYEWTKIRRDPKVVDMGSGARVTAEELAGICDGSGASGLQNASSATPAPIESADLESANPAPMERSRRAPMDLSSAPVVAVFEIEDASSGSNRKVLGQLTEYLAAQLTASGYYRAIPPSSLRTQIVAAQAASYRQCYDQACQIELGKALAAEKTVATKLLRIGKVCALTATLFDLRTEAADAAASTRTDCKEASLMDAVDRIVHQLVDGRGAH